MTPVLIGVVTGWALIAGLGGYVAGEKGRPAGEGLVLGLLFGPLGVIVEALLPSIDARPSRGARRCDRSRLASADEPEGPVNVADFLAIAAKGEADDLVRP